MGCAAILSLTLTIDTMPQGGISGFVACLQRAGGPFCTEMLHNSAVLEQWICVPGLNPRCRIAVLVPPKPGAHHVRSIVVALLGLANLVSQMCSSLQAAVASRWCLPGLEAALWTAMSWASNSSFAAAVCRGLRLLHLP